MNAELKHCAVNQELSESFKPDLADKDLREMNISEMTADEIRVTNHLDVTQTWILYTLWYKFSQAYGGVYGFFVDILQRNGHEKRGEIGINKIQNVQRFVTSQ